MKPYCALLIAACSLALSACSPSPEAATPPAARTSVGTEIDDTVITSKVKAALLVDPDIRSLDVNVETRKGEVQLSGFVNSKPQIDLAIALARKVDGVRGVSNEMSVKQ